MKIKIITILVLLTVLSLSGCSFSSSSVSATTEPDAIAYEMATLDNGEISKDDPVINEYKIFLDRIEDKTVSSRVNILNITKTAQELLKEGGIDKTLLKILKDFNSYIPEGPEGFKLEEVALAYMIIMTEEKNK